MFRRFFYYLSLSVKDLVRLWAVTQHHIVIVTGICLPILLLMGLKRGHVETLRTELVTSPTGRQVTFWSSRNGELMSQDSLQTIKSDIPHVDVLIPETQRVVSLTHQTADDPTVHTVDVATLYSTKSGDPVLAQLDTAVPAAGEKELVLSETLSEQLQATIGDEVTVILQRGRGAQTESQSVPCQVIGIIPTQEAGAAIGYADVRLLDMFESYVRGYKVTELGWPAAKKSAPDTYAGYLLFCERTNNLTEADVEYLQERGFRVAEQTETAPAGLEFLLTPDWQEKLVIYHLTTERSAEAMEHWLQIAPSQISEGTSADDVVLAWNHPVTVESGDSSRTLVGLSMSQRTWLREYFRDPSLPFNYDASGNIQRPGLPANDDQRTELMLTNGSALQLTTSRDTKGDAAPDDAASEDSERTDPPELDSVVAVPANLLSWLAQERSGQVIYDADIALFVGVPRPAVYDRVRLFAQTIDNVPDIVEELVDRRFAVMSETGRITEIHQQDQSLQILVIVVGMGVFLFGVVTVFSVLMDSTDRKRGTIGILRVMGMSRSGVFLTVLIRAGAIGTVAAILSIALGYGLSAFLGWTPPDTMAWLQWKPGISVSFVPADLVTITAGAMICCVCGAVPPALRASRLDPFDAIIEGRFH